MKALTKSFMLFLIMEIWGNGCFGAIPAFQDRNRDTKEQYFYVRGQGVILRKSPGAKARSIARVDSASLCKSVYQIGEWVQVKFNNGKEGFIHQSQLSPCLPELVKFQQLEQSPITDIIDDSLNSLLSSQLKEIEKFSEKAAFWRWMAVISTCVNLFLIGIAMRFWLFRRQALKDYVEFKELATIQKSRENLQWEIDLLTRTNKNLEKKILQLEEKLKKA